MVNVNNSMFSKEEISHFVESENLKCQSIQLPYDIKTPGDTRNEAIKAMLGELKKSQTVLDIGCSLGLFCLTALQQGARKATGLELNSNRLRQANKIADFLQLKPSYLRLDIEKYPELEKHDIVLCLKILDHLKNPIGVLRHLALLTNDTLIIDAKQFEISDIKPWAKLLHKQSKLHGLLRRLVPTALKGSPSAFAIPYSPKSSLRSFFFSPAAIDAILSTHMKLFSSVEIKPSGSNKQCFIVCKKLKIKHLILVSGMCGSGKSTFIENSISKGRSPELGLHQERLTIVSGNSLRNKKLSDSFSHQFNNIVIFHYDILSINRYEINSYDRDASLDILTCAEKVSAVILAPDQDTLLNQMLSSESKDGYLSSYHSELRSNYQSLDWLRETSLDWLDFLKKRLSNSDCNFYEYNGTADQLRLTPGADSLRETIEERYSA